MGKDIINAARIKLNWSIYFPLKNKDSMPLINEEVIDTKKMPEKVIMINLRNCPFFLKIIFLWIKKLIGIKILHVNATDKG